MKKNQLHTYKASMSGGNENLSVKVKADIFICIFRIPIPR